MKNGGVWRRLAGSLLGTRQIYLCGAVSAAGEPLQIYPRKQTANLSGMAWFTVLHDSLPFYGLSFQR